jgi:2,4-dienoyl-CoA reductase-like NADH-dependent reductase (Old Yellow Enzyme family)
MTADDFRQATDAFVHAALASKDIGCDAIELHGAHGYLLDSFLSPAVNQRDDDYGGSLENRMRFPLEVTRAVRAAVGPDYPIIYRFSQWSVEDYHERKFHNPDELAVFVTALKEAGVDVLHVSTRRATDPAFEDVSDRTLAGWARELSGLPTIAVGSVSVTLTMDEAYGDDASVIADPGPGIALVEDGEADLLAVGRALIPNPDWVKIVRDGDWRSLQPFHKDQLKTLV